MAGQQRFLAQILVSLLNAREAESARVSRLLHDEVGQVLSAVGLHLTVCRMDLHDREPEVAQRTLEIQNMLEQAVSMVRDLSYELNPDIVARVGLHYALERLLTRQREHFAGTIRFIDSLTSPLPVPVATSFYKIAEQAVENAVRHSESGQIHVFLRPDTRQVSLEIRDAGKGFQVSSAERDPVGLGLLLMKLHAERAGLRLSVKSSLKRGTIVRAICSLPEHAGKAEEAAVPPSMGPTDAEE